MDLKCSQQVEGMDATVVHTDAQASPTKEKKRFVEKKNAYSFNKQLLNTGAVWGGENDLKRKGGCPPCWHMPACAGF